MKICMWLISNEYRFSYDFKRHLFLFINLYTVKYDSTLFGSLIAVIVYIYILVYYSIYKKKTFVNWIKFKTDTNILKLYEAKRDFKY